MIKRFASVGFVSLVFLVGSIGSLVRSDEGETSIAVRVDRWIDQKRDQLLSHYFWLHQNPEVSFHEDKTADYVARVWREVGFEVTPNVGGFGVVGVLRNGNGPTLMLRTDLDALPVTEATGLPYASTKTTLTAEGVSTGTMHACGHDLHMTCVTGAGQFLSEHLELWRGTLLLIGQPAEERGAGAKAMLNDGLFERFPKPDFAIALHVESATPANAVSLRSGYLLANVDSIDIEIRGRGGHGASPETCVDPVVQAAELILSLQTIVSREIKPTEPAVVTVGSIHGGTKHNIISESCSLQLTVRSYSDDVRNRILQSIERKAKAIAIAYDAPEPTIRLSEGTPALRNDDQLTIRIRTALTNAIGKDRVLEAEQVMGGEDFSQFGLAGVPILMYRLGTLSKERMERFKLANVTPPSLHSPTFYPDLEESLPTGVASMIHASLSILGPSSTATGSQSK